jgi:hypothetical protein
MGFKECWALLLARGFTEDKLVVPAGTDPNERRRHPAPVGDGARLPSWCGWWRPPEGGSWLRVAETATFTDTWRALFRVSVGGDRLVLPEGTDPNEGRR